MCSIQASVDLRAKSPLRCGSLDADVIISKVYFNHIAFAKRRGLKDLAKRLGMIPLVPEMLLKGKLILEEEREGRVFYRIQLKKSELVLIAIVIRRPDGLALLSSFVQDKKGK